MTDQDPDLEEVGSPSKPEERPTRLWVVSGKRLLCGPFLAALQSALDPDDEFEIVVDRRRAHVVGDARPDGSVSVDARPPATEQPCAERRHHPHLDRWLRLDGFAIVPVRAARREHRTPLSPLLPEVPIEPVFSEDDERLESVRNFKAERAGRLATSVVFVGLMTVVVVLLASVPAVKNFVSRARLEAPPSEGQPERAGPDNRPRSERAETLPATANPTFALQPGFPETLSPVMTENSLADAASESPSPSVREPTRSARPRTTRTSTGRAQEAAAGAGVVLDPRTTPAPKLNVGAHARPIVGALAPDTPAVSFAAPRFPGLPRVDVVRSSAATGAGLGESFALRIWDPAGRPLAGADVLLLAPMADGTVRYIPLGAGPEPGTYQGTVQGSRTAVDLRVRVTTSDKRVEIPLTP
jgi:hypothetical protein